MVIVNRPKPCVICGVRVTDGNARCEQHRVGRGTGRMTSCLVCARPTMGRFCELHEPELDEAIRNARNPYRREYSSREYAVNRQHRFERARGRCELCGATLVAGEWDCDHLVALSRGGTNAIENLRVLCRPCHKAKTAADRRNKGRN